MSDEDLVVDDDNDNENDAVLTDSAMIAKEAERARIQAQIDEFLNRGGEITRVETNVMTDPPKRPASNYGGQPI